MVEVRIKMDTVVFSCDKLDCTVELTNSSAIEQTIAWCSAHVHCNCVFAQSKLSLFETPPKRHIVQANAFSPTRGEKGHCIYETDAAVLCCDQTLGPSESRSFHYETSLPVFAPPSYKGENIAYFHKLAIGLQRVGNQAELLRIPLRILPVDRQLAVACKRESAIYAARLAGRLESAIGRPTLLDDPADFGVPDVITPIQAKSMRSSPEAVYRADVSDAVDIKIEMQFDPNESPAASPSRDRQSMRSMIPITPVSTSGVHFEEGRRKSTLLGPRDGSIADMPNPFVPKDEDSFLARDHILHAITSLSRRRKPSVFKISTSNSKETVAKFFLSKPVFKIGEDVSGWIDFSEATIPCYQVLVSLEIEEDIDEKYWKKAGEKFISKVSQVRQKEFCKNLSTVPIMLPIPLASSPQFEADHVCIKWRISFEFLMDSKHLGMTKTHVKNSSDKIYSIPTDVEVDQLKWSLPIQVLPTNPVYLPSNQKLMPQLIPVQSSPKHPTFVRS